MMLKLLALLATACLFACGSASTAAPKATNPPVVKEPPPAVDESWTLTLDQIGVMMTIPNQRWKLQEVTNDDGTKFVKADLEGTSVSLFMKPYLNPDESPLKALAEIDRQLFLGDPTMTVSDVEDDGDGRWTFLVDAQGSDGNLLRGRMYFVPSQVRSDGYFAMAVIGLASEYDQYAGEARGIIKSIRPLPN